MAGVFVIDLEGEEKKAQSDDDDALDIGEVVINLLQLSPFSYACIFLAQFLKFLFGFAGYLRSTARCRCHYQVRGYMLETD